jgi:nucleoside-triphosphatase THEP1
MSDNAHKSVFIMTGKTRSGKTTFLLDLIEELRRNTLSIAGFAALSVPEDGPSGSYHILDLVSGKILPLASRRITEGWELFGQFYFNPEGIYMGKEILENPLIIHQDIIVVDEIGPFELEGKIWADCLTRLLGRQYPSILLVVREALVPQVIHQWSLKDAMIIDTGRIKPGQAATMILSKTGGTRPLKRH